MEDNSSPPHTFVSGPIPLHTAGKLVLSGGFFWLFFLRAHGTLSTQNSHLNGCLDSQLEEKLEGKG